MSLAGTAWAGGDKVIIDSNFTGRQGCGQWAMGSVEVSKVGGIGQIESHGKLAAVVERDEGSVALVSLKSPYRPKVLGRYGSDVDQPFDGDVAFSSDGQHLFYARQTHQFSLDGIHVLDISDPTAPALTDYEPQGGTLRIASYQVDGIDYVVSLDATTGLVVHRFVDAAGVIVPVYTEPLPALKVGGPSSAGIVIEEDPALGIPVMYVTTGKTGLDIYDFSDPTQPAKLGSWTDEIGLADIEVVATKKSRKVYAATEYWFNKTLAPEVIELDATDPTAIEEVGRIGFGIADDAHRVQGIDVVGGDLVIGHSTEGALWYDLKKDKLTDIYRKLGPRNEGAAMLGSPYAMDVEDHEWMTLVSDGSSGRLTVFSQVCWVAMSGTHADAPETRVDDSRSSSP